MTFEKWQETAGKIKDSFTILDEGKEELEDGGILEYLEFENQQGVFRMEYTSRPLVVDKKTIYSNRANATVKVDYIYSQTERSGQLEVFQWNKIEEEWEKVK